jgi:hypothetical protein
VPPEFFEPLPDDLLDGFSGNRCRLHVSTDDVTWQAAGHSLRNGRPASAGPVDEAAARHLYVPRIIGKPAAPRPALAICFKRPTTR